MKKEPDFGTLLKEPGVQVYLFVSLVSLGLVLMVQLAKGHVILNAVIFLVGVLGIVARFGSAPVVLLFVLALGELFSQQMRLGMYGDGRPGLWIFSLVDALQCLGVLGYTIGQMRFMGLTAYLLPKDTRMREEATPQNPIPFQKRRRMLQKRSPGLFTPLEFGLCIILLPVWAMLAQFLWFWLSWPRHIFGLSFTESILILLFWSLFLLLFIISSILRFWRWYSLEPKEAELYLQDTYWRETRREQRRQYRWLAWARVKNKYRKVTK